MRYFRHSELADKYHVSLKTVHNWIDAAKRGGADLKLHKVNRFTYIADTPENDLVLRQLADKGKKYRNTLHHKVVSPKPEFYEIFSRRQILDIITNLNVHGEIPRQYNYHRDGAKSWDIQLQALASENNPNILKGTVDLIHSNLATIDALLVKRKKVNIIDLGAGNAYPVKELVGHLWKRHLLNRYIAIDISPDMLEVAQNNIRDWYGDTFPFEGHVRDVTKDRFDDLVVDDMLSADGGETLNLVLLLGATPSNFRVFSDVFKTAYSSMGVDDILLYTDKLDTEASRRLFAYSSEGEKLASTHSYLPKLLGITDDLYEVERGFDDSRRMKYVRIRLNAAMTIDFKFEGESRKISFEKGETLLILRAWFLTPLETIAQFEDAGFTLLHSSLTSDRQYFLSISGVNIREGALRS